jgi:nucleotide-binding universal stress UspA family protein
VSIVFDSARSKIESVLHPTDLSPPSLSAFHHALAIAIHTGAELTLLHAVARRTKDGSVDFPQVRNTLARWRKAGTTRSLEEKIRATTIRKIEASDKDPVAACTAYMEQEHVDMIVLATGQRTGLAKLARPSKAEALVRESRRYTLFVPAGARPIVSAETGTVTLRRILLPVHPATDPKPAMMRAVQSATLLDDPDLEVTLLHIGAEPEEREMDLPQLPYCQWRALARPGRDAAAGILEAAAEIEADAIYMASSWQKPGLASKVGGVTEAVLERATCPVAVVPSEAAA